MNGKSAKQERSSALVRVGIAGLGRAAVFEHIPELLALPHQFRITAVCDLLKSRRDHVTAICPDVKTYRRIEDMLDDPDIDLVDICTRTSDHVPHAMESLKREKWTVLESPMATSREDALALRAQSVKAHNRLVVRLPGVFSPDFTLARKMMSDKRLGDIYDIRVFRCGYVRRDDWQSVRRCGGGIRFYALPEALLQALSLIGSPPTKMWSEFKHLASLGDAEDYVRMVLSARDQRSVCIVASGASLDFGKPSFVISGTRGSFTVNPGSSEGVLRAINPALNLPRRRCSVRTPPLENQHEELDIINIPVSLTEEEKTATGGTAFWNAVHDAMRRNIPFPSTLDDSIEVLRLIDLASRTSR